MESANLNSAPEHNEDATLRALLNTAMPPLADGGFSRRVIAAFPAPEDTTLLWRRLRFCLVGSAIGSACAIWGIISGVDASGGNPLGADLLAIAVRFTEPPLALALVVVIGSLLYVFGAELKEKLFE